VADEERRLVGVYGGPTILQAGTSIRTSGRRSLHLVKIGRVSFVKGVHQSPPIFHWATTRGGENAEGKGNEAHGRDIERKGEGKRGKWRGRHAGKKNPKREGT